MTSNSVYVQVISYIDFPEVDLIAMAIDNDSSPLFGSNSLCYYNHTKINEPFRKIGEKTYRTVASLTPDTKVFKALNDDDIYISDQIVLDPRYRFSIGLSCFNKKQTLKNWRGYVRIISNNKEILRFTKDDILNLEKSRFMQICIFNPIAFNSSFLSSLVFKKLTLPVDCSVVIYNRIEDWLKEYGFS